MNLFFSFLFFVIFGLLFNQYHGVIQGVRMGLTLWYDSLVPVLFPFLIFTNMLIHGHIMDSLPTRFFKPLCRLFHCSVYELFAIVIGFLCGCPISAKIISDMVSEGTISRDRGQNLLVFCNQLSPMFLMGYVYPRLPSQISPLAFLGLLYGIPFCLWVITNRMGHFTDLAVYASSRPETPLPDLSVLLDTCIMKAIVVMTKIGGYVILCSICMMIICQIPSCPVLLTASCEITNGCVLLSSQHCPLYQWIGLCAFGGWCTVLQIQGMITGTGLSIRKYIRAKLSLALFIAWILSLIYQ